MDKFTFYKGIKDDEMIKLEFDKETNLSQVRLKLIEKGFIPKEATQTLDFSFLTYQISEEELKNDEVPVAILKSLEKRTLLEDVKGPAGQIVLTNIAKTKNTDLIGINTDWLFDGNMGVKVSLNEYDDEAKRINKELKAFEPLLMKSVRPTSKKAVGFYDNVCICVEGSAIKFTVSSWGEVGFNFSIKPEQGEPIRDAYCGYEKNEKNIVKARGVYNYADSSLILVKGSDTLGIPTKEAVSYQRIHIKTRSMKGYTWNDERYGAPTPPQGERSSDLSSSPDSSNSVSPSSLVKAGIVAGDSIKTGSTTKGSHTVRNPNTIWDIYQDDWSKAQGEIILYLFVFKTWEAAQKVIEGYNSIDPHQWD